ncbi:COX15/CtaA family protein [Oryzomicrobium terrae]|nr:COX15/CtaA family protein [Oryzomicrobium terrae]
MTFARYRRLALLAALLALGVVALGAYVRLSDAGLGCPDWPGCYGHLVGVPDAPHEHAQAARLFPDRPVEAAKAWKEMIHRYAAGTLGLLIAALAVGAWRGVWTERGPLRRALPTALVGLVLFQALLGMWTVTLLLKPLVVTAHLLGGMLTWGGLLALNLQLRPNLTPAPERLPAASPGLRRGAALFVLLVLGQIALGGWVSSNYAALACGDFPACTGGLTWPAADWHHAFTLDRSLGATADGALLPGAALTAIHLAHRAGALAVLAAAAALALALLRQGHRGAAATVTGLTLLQAGLGVANVLATLPLPLAVAHNTGAALLLAGALALCHRLARAPRRDRDAPAPRPGGWRQLHPAG